MSTENPTPGADRPTAPSNTAQSRFPTFVAARRAFFPTFTCLGRGALRVTGRGWKRSRPWVLRLGLVLVVLHTGLNVYASLLVNRELAEIRAKGEPLTLPELAPRSVPDAQNAAFVYQKAYEAVPKADTRIDPFLGEVNSEGKFDIAAFLGRNRKAVELTRRAADMPRCRFPLDYKGSPVKILFPHYAQQRALARVLSIQAQWEAKRGDVGAALRDVRRIYAVANSVADEPVLIGFLVSRAIHQLGERTLAQILATAAITPSQGRAFVQTLPRTDWSRTYRRAFLSERTFSIWAFQNIRFSPGNLGEIVSEGTTLPAWLLFPAAWVWRPLAKMDELYDLQMWKPIIADLTPMQVPMSLRSDANMERELQNAPSYAIMTRILFPVFARARIHRDHLEVAEREQQVALALAAYRSRYGRYPDTLAEAEALWGTKLPLDLYTKAPFLYRKTAQGFALYSVGPNRSDDKGDNALLRRPDEKRVDPSADDVAWGRRHQI